MSAEPKRLYRSRTQRMLGGVAGGLAEYFNVDPTLVRLLFVIFSLAGGPGLIAYIILWIVMPEVPSGMVVTPPSARVVEPTSENVVEPESTEEPM
jgi:phage shock protein PspC (stress-responsive transcriptional regulator)